MVSKSLSLLNFLQELRAFVAEAIRKLQPVLLEILCEINLQRALRLLWGKRLAYQVSLPSLRKLCRPAIVRKVSS